MLRSASGNKLPCRVLRAEDDAILEVAPRAGVPLYLLRADLERTTSCATAAILGA